MTRHRQSPGNRDHDNPDGQGEHDDVRETIADDAAENERYAEREKDVLVRLIGRRALHDLDPSDASNALFFDWAARDARARQPLWERRATATEGRAFAERVLARRRASRVMVREMAGAPPYAAALVSGSAREVLAAAAPMRHAPAVDLAVAAGLGRELWDEPCERWIRLPDDVPDGGHIALVVAGDSMRPLLQGGDTILVRLGAELASHAVVVARHPENGYVVKQLGRVGRESIELISLNPAYTPITIPHDDALILGTVVVRWREHD